MEGSGGTGGGIGGGGWRPPQGDPNMNPDAAVSTEWRSQLQPEARSRIVTKIMDTLKKHLPISGPEGLSELKKIAVRFEEKIFSGATSQADYLRKISMKMLSMEQKTHSNGSANALATNSNIVNQTSPDAVNMIQSQARNQGAQMTMQMPNQSQPNPQLLSQNLQNNLTKAPSDASAMTSMTGLPHSTIASTGQNSNVQAMPSIPQNSLTNSGQSVTSNLYGNSQRQMQVRQLQQQLISTAQQQQSQNQLVYQQQQQQQQQQQLLKQKMSHPSLLQSQITPQQKQPLLQQTNQLQSSQQPLMQMAPGLQPNQVTLPHQQPSMIQPTPQPGLQQNQQNSIQQSAQSVYQSQSVVRQQTQASSLQSQTSSILQQPSSITQQPVLPSQQQQMLGNQTGVGNLQPRQIHGQQNTVPDLQQQQQHQRLQNQQNNLLGMQQQHQMMNQQNISLQHQQQLISQTGISGLQQQTQQHQQQSQQQQQHHQNQLLGPQSNVSNMQQHQHSMNMLQQSKVSGQQMQQTSVSLLQPQGQSQTQQMQQPHMPLQSQPTQVQQQMSMQQRLQASASVDPTAQNAQTGVDLQEEGYQKIKSLKELYFAEASEMYQKYTVRLQQMQNETHLLPGKQSEHLEYLKKVKIMLERSLQFMQLPKSSVQPLVLAKLPMYEKQIPHLLNTHRTKRSVPSQSPGQQQFQQSNVHNQPTSQQSQPQIGQMQQPENHMNQLQQMKLQNSVTPVQSTTTPSMQSGSVSASGQMGGPLSQQNMTNSLQPCSNLDSSQGNTLSASQQSPVTSVGSLLQAGSGHVHQNAINSQTQSGINNSMPNSMNSMQSMSNSMQQNSNVLQQQIKQEQQQLMQAHQIKQQFQQRQLQQQFFQQQLMQQQKSHMLQPQQQQQQQQQSSQLQQHIQQRQQQQQQQQQQQLMKQQQSSQVQSHQIAQINQINEINDLKMRQVPGMKPGLYQSAYPTNKVQPYYQSQLKSGASFPISSPQNLQATSPLVSQHSSPQVDQQILSSLPKAGTPLQSATPPFVVPSPSTPLAPSPLPGDHEKQLPGASSLSNAGNIAHPQSGGVQAQTQSIAVGTPGMSASPLLAEFTNTEGYQNNTTTAPGKALTKEQPLERLKKVVQSSSPAVLSSSINDIGSVVTMVDRIAGSAPGNGSRAAVGEDLVAMTKCRLQARTFMNQDTGATAKKMKRTISSMPLNAISSLDSGNDSFKQLGSHDASELESTATSNLKRSKHEASHTLLEEIKDINLQLIDTTVDVEDDGTKSVAEGEGTIVKCTFSAVALSPNLQSQFDSAEMSPILPLRLLVPTKYPSTSPILLDKVPLETSKEPEDLSAKAKSSFSRSLRGLSQPMSLKDMAMTWDVSARKVILEYAERNGGGSFSSRYGSWKSCLAA